MAVRIPLVSIITPTYNHEKYIGQCIESVLSQTYTNWEMMIVDDGSTDHTTEVVSKYPDSRIHLIRREHLGPWGLTEAYNQALYVARGEYIAILEGDDYWLPHKLHVQLQTLQDDAVVLSYGNCYRMLNDGVLFEFAYAPDSIDQRENRPVGAALKTILGVPKTTVEALTAVIRRDALDRVGGFVGAPFSMVVDYPTFLELSLIGEFRYVEMALGVRRYYSQSISASLRPEMMIGVMDYALYFCKRHSSEIKASDITPWIEDYLLACRYKTIGYGAMQTGEWRKARENFLLGLKSYPRNDPLTRGVVLGLIGSLLHVDVLRLFFLKERLLYFLTSRNHRILEMRR